MAEFQRRLERLEANIKPPDIGVRVIFLVVIPAVAMGGVCPEFVARGVQSGQCGDRTFTREPDETEAAFRSRIFNAVKIPGGVPQVILT